jgi:hypothetical protein
MPFNFRKRSVRREFTLSGRSKIGHTREYYYSLFATLMVKIVLFISLCMLFASSVRIMRTSFRSISEAWRFIMPSAVAIIAIFFGYRIYKDIKYIRSYSKEMERARREKTGT